MKILLFTPKFSGKGGVANFYQELQPYLNDDYHFVLRFSRSDFNLWKKIVLTFCDIIRMFCLIAFGGYDAIYLNPSLGTGAVRRDVIYLIMARLFGKKTIVFWHGWDHPYQEKLEKSKFLKLFKKTFCKADLTFVLASEFKNKLIEWGNHNKIELMTTCYDNDLENGEPDYDLNNKIPLLFISRVERAKGVFIALESFKILENKFPDRFSLTIAGDGSALAEAKQYAADNQLKVDFPGYIRGEDKKTCYYKHFFFFFCTSYGEGLPCALLEAMACGLVPIIRPVGGIPDIFEDGKMGIMSESLEPEFYAEKIIELMADMPKLRQISEFNREYAKNNFSASKVAKKIMNCCDNILKDEYQLPVIIIGLAPQGLALLRNLSRNGYNVYAFADSGKQAGMKSRYGRKYLYRNIYDLKCQLNVLKQKYSEKLFCIVTSGEALGEILQNYRELYDDFNVESGPLEILDIFCHKDQMYQWGIERKVKCAKFKLLNKYKHGDLSFPLILKRNYEVPTPFKVKLLRNLHEFDEIIKIIPNNLSQYFILQEWLDYNKLEQYTCQTYCSNGKILAAFCAQQTRMLRSKGFTSLLTEITDSIFKNKILKETNKFFVGSNFSGFSEIEWLYDSETDEFFLLEINTRSCGSTSAFIHKYNQIGQLCTKQNKPNMQETHKNIVWMNILRDIRARIEQHDFSNIFLVFHCYHDIFDLKDIKPFLWQFFKWLF